jgi:hypothetical protein
VPADFPEQIIPLNAGIPLLDFNIALDNTNVSIIPTNKYPLVELVNSHSYEKNILFMSHST